MDFIKTFGAIVLFYAIKLLFDYFWPNYFKAKGTNKATIEDTGIITEIQEAVKAEFAKQNETIKAELNFSNQHKLNLMALEREAIFEFNNSFCVLQSKILDIIGTKIIFKNVSECTEKISDLRLLNNNFSINLAKLSLFFIGDSTFNEEKLNLLKEFNNYLVEFSKITDEIELIESIWKKEGKYFNTNKLIILNDKISGFKISNEDNYRNLVNNYSNLITYLSDKFKA